MINAYAIDFLEYEEEYPLKKFIFVLLCFILFLSQTSCGNQIEASETQADHQSSADSSISTEASETQADHQTSADSGINTEDPENTEPYFAEDTADTNLSDKISDEELNKILDYSLWYHYYMDGEYYKLYTLEFDTAKGRMKWCNGWWQSEYENTFDGSFTADKNGEFRADLYDELRDVTIQMVFSVEAVNADTDNGEIIFTITDISLDKYKTLLNQPLKFTDDHTPNYPQVYEEYSVELQASSHNIVIDLKAEPRLTLNEQVLYDGSGEEIFRFNILENTAADNYFDSAAQNDIQYIEDTGLSGMTGNGYRYSVYYRDVEYTKGQYGRQYKIFVVIDETVTVLADVNHYTFRDCKDESAYYNQNILAMVDSLTVKD